jgi:predicted RNA-binding Zn-ribbon protein involved in translation (DUF1610 family)
MLAVSEMLARRDVLQVVKTQKEERRKMEWFLDTVARLESVAPGIVFGTVDVVCCGCGETSSHNCNADGSNAYVCPHCGMRNEL